MSQGYFSCVIQDTVEHTGWAWQFFEALKEGTIYPRWMPLKFWGYGSPIFVLYPPLAYYFVALVSLFTGSVITAMNITKSLSLFICGTGMFFLVKEFYSKKIALLSASFYMVLPYTVFQLYFIGTFASTISYVWFAPIILFTYRYMKNRQHRHILYAGLCYGGLILTHLVYAYMFSYVIITFIVYMSISEKRLRDITIVPFIVIIGILISSAYVLPLVYEKQFMQLEAITKEGFNFAKFFILPNLTDRFPTGSVWPVYYDTYLLHALFFITLTVIFSFQIVRYRYSLNMKHERVLAMFFIIVAAASIFLLFGISTYIWKTFPYFKYISFPYRWLSIAAFAIAFLSAPVFRILERINKTKRRNIILILSLFVICLLLDYKYISSATFFSENELIPVRAANWVTTEYLPKWVSIDKIHKDDNFQLKRVETSGEGDIKIVTWESSERDIEITARAPLTVKIRTFYFPGWESYSNGVKTDIGIEEGTGAMLVKIPQGSYMLSLRFKDTPVRYYAKIISLIAFFIIVFITLFSWKKKR
jgi:uncharacterized membrane protein